MVELMFHGAAGEVTGSMHMLHIDGAWVALDCGMFQGRRADSIAKNRQWPVPPDQIVAVVLSHAHIDHCGRLPKLVADGFNGRIFCTSATRDLCSIMLQDSAHIQQEDAEFLNRRRARQNLPPIEPLYTQADAVAAVKLMQSMQYDRPFSVEGVCEASYREAGHMLGSAGILLQLPAKSGRGRSIYFTGDIGRQRTPILRDPAFAPKADIVLSESTYGARVNPPLPDAEKQFLGIVKQTFERGGKVIIPAFSVGRTQTITYFLQNLFEAGLVPRHSVYVDSPLAVAATEVFKMHPECYDADAKSLQSKSGGIFGGQFVQYIRDVEDSMKLNTLKGPCIIISASGMCESGRILHHLKNHAGDAKNTILIPGFQAINTLGRRLVDGVREVMIYGEPVFVRAEVLQLHGFSGHADQAELLSFLTPLAKGDPEIYLVHGEPEQSTGLRDNLMAAGMRKVTVAQRGQRVQVG